MRKKIRYIANYYCSKLFKFEHTIVRTSFFADVKEQKNVREKEWLQSVKGVKLRNTVL